VCKHDSIAKDREREEAWLYKCEGCGKEFLPEDQARRLVMSALYEFIYREDVTKILHDLASRASLSYEEVWDEDLVKRTQHELQLSAEDHVRFVL
jgi:hypothetical protein